MKYSELYPDNDNGVGTIFQNVAPNEFTKIFGTLTVGSVNLYTRLTYGNSNLINAVFNDTAADIIEAIIKMNVDTWIDQFNALSVEYTTGSKTVTHTISDKRVNLDTLSETTGSKPFNETDFVDSDQTDNDDKRQETFDRNEQETTTGSDAADAIKKELQLRQFNLRKNVIFAIIKEITKKIY